MSATEDIRESIQSRLRAIEAEVVSLNHALKRLDAEGAGPVQRVNGRKGTRPRARTRATEQARKPQTRSDRTVAPATPATLEQLLRAADGISAGRLAEQLNADRGHVLARLKELEAQGNVRRTGERRGTRWHAITDEDRIRERAAELERRSRRRPAAAE